MDDPLCESWRAFGATVRGASHRRRRLPNQDALGWYPLSAEGGVVALAVADGHGSPKCFRSDAGAGLAVRVALSIVSEFVDNSITEDALPKLRAAAEWLPERIARAWRDAVEEDLRAHPFSPKEASAGKANPLLAYGTTILAVVAAPEFLVCAQLGDGDILLVAESGEVSRPWQDQKKILGFETTSLCTADAASEMRVAVFDAAPLLPELVLLSTDGYSNSFREERGFLQIGSDVLRLIREEGLNELEKDLPGWLNEASELGSGDDITLGGLSRTAPGSSGNGA
jgi:hypothetical protein